MLESYLASERRILVFKRAAIMVVLLLTFSNMVDLQRARLF